VTTAAPQSGLTVTAVVADRLPEDTMTSTHTPDKHSTRSTVAALATATALAAGGLALIGTAPAQAGGSTYRVSRSGACSGSAVWKLKAKADDGRIEVELEIDSNRSGQVWDVTLRRDGDRVWSGSRTTAGRSGSFSVGRRISNSPGDDVIVGRATHGRQVCRGQVTYAR
jgi:hypothetical protein